LEEIKISNDVLFDEIYISESLLVATMWNMPSLYSTYGVEKLNISHLGNKIWQFYLGLGREMFNKGIQIFDDITVEKTIKEISAVKRIKGQYKKYGEYETIEQLMEMTKGLEDNFESLFEEVKKYALLRGLRDLFGVQVITKTPKYDYHTKTRQEIDNYWAEKLSEIQMNTSDSKIKEYNLLGNLDQLVDKLDDDNNVGLPFYDLENFTHIMNGWAKGTVYLLSAFSGMGKSSFIVFAIIMSCIKYKQKLVIIANEMDVEAYQKLLLATVMGNPLHEEMIDKYKSEFNRRSLDNGKFIEKDKERVKRAVQWIKENMENEELIKFIPIDHYTMDSVEQTLRFYKRKGYDYAVIDTCKPSENRGNRERWVQFVDDFETIYKLAKKDSLDMGLFCTVQNADSYINTKFLDYSIIGDGKKIKNTVDFCCHIRSVHDSEKKGDGVLKVEGFDKKPVKLKPLVNYYLMFVSKNRRGLANLTSNLPVLVMSVDLNTNSWKEIGWTKIVNDLQ
jgi:replicative DNA helicase